MHSCTDAFIKTFITTAEQEQMLVRFVEDLTQVNRGRAFFASCDSLEQTVFVDVLRNRRRRVR